MRGWVGAKQEIELCWSCSRLQFLYEIIEDKSYDILMPVWVSAKSDTKYPARILKPFEPLTRYWIPIFIIQAKLFGLLLET